MRPKLLLQSAGWIAVVAMLALSSPGVRISPDPGTQGAGPSDGAVVREAPARP